VARFVWRAGNEKSASFVAFTAALVSLVAACAGAQKPDYVSPVTPARAGRAPGMRVKLVRGSSERRTYVIIFRTGDETVSGLTNFARQYGIVSAHYLRPVVLDSRAIYAPRWTFHAL
jgi:hypothetical protein